MFSREHGGDRMKKRIYFSLASITTLSNNNNLKTSLIVRVNGDHNVRKNSLCGMNGLTFSENAAHFQKLFINTA